MKSSPTWVLAVIGEAFQPAFACRTLPHGRPLLQLLADAKGARLSGKHRCEQGVLEPSNLTCVILVRKSGVHDGVHEILHLRR